jgi:hypothetical protein
MPRRQDIDPVDIWSLLPYLHLSEWHTKPDGVFFRIAGTELVATAGQEFRGRWLHEITPNEPDLEQVMNLYYRVIATRVPSSAAPTAARSDSASSFSNGCSARSPMTARR